MKNAHLFLIGFFATAAAVGACTVEPADGEPSTAGDAGSDSPSTPAEDAETEDRGEWTEYTPAEIEGTESGEFTANDDVKSFDLPATDLGGGLLHVTVSPHNVEVGLWLAEGEKADEQRWEGSYSDPEQASGSFYLRLHGGKSYQLRAYPLNYSVDEPNPYRVSWTYEPLVDGYEPNETVEQAKRIPISKPISAYAHAIGPDSRLVGSVADDWYKFELTEDKTVKLSVDRGAEHSSYFAVLDGEGAPVSCADTNFAMSIGPAQPGTVFETCEGPLSAGTYWVHVGIGNSEYPGTGTGEELPPHFKANYTFTVDAN